MTARAGWRRIAMRRRDRADDRGVTAVEAALITPIFMLVVIGIIEYGLVFKDQLAVTSAVRAGARMASAEPRISTFATDAAAQVAKAGAALPLADVDRLWVYQADASGHPMGPAAPSRPARASCVTFRWTGSSFVQSGGSWPSTSAERRVRARRTASGIYLKFKHPGVTKVFFQQMDLTSHTVMRLEPIPPLQAGGCK